MTCIAGPECKITSDLHFFIDAKNAIKNYLNTFYNHLNINQNKNICQLNEHT